MCGVSVSSRHGGRGWEGWYDDTRLRAVEAVAADRDRPQRSLCAVLVDMWRIFKLCENLHLMHMWWSQTRFWNYIRGQISCDTKYVSFDFNVCAFTLALITVSPTP